MLILGIDSGTKTGWCLYDGIRKKIIESGVEDFSKKRGEGNGMLFLKFRVWIKKIIHCADDKLSLIIYEQAHHRGGFATELCVNLTGRIQEEAEAAGITCATVPTSTLKKWATGKGNAGKGEMLAYAKKVLGRNPIDDNEADAVALAEYGNNQYLET